MSVNTVQLQSYGSTSTGRLYDNLITCTPMCTPNHNYVNMFASYLLITLPKLFYNTVGFLVGYVCMFGVYMSMAIKLTDVNYYSYNYSN